MFNIPRDNQLACPPAVNLGDFFHEAYRLICIDSGMMQNVIRKLASEGGLHRIRQLLAQDFQTPTSFAQRRIFEHQIMPLFKVLTEPDVLDSLILEAEVARLFAFVFGVNGARAMPLFEFMATMLATLDPQEEHFVLYLEKSAVVLSKMLDFNTLASVQSTLAHSAKQIEEVFIRASVFVDRYLLLATREHLERLLRRLNLGVSFPTTSYDNEAPTSSNNTAFIPHVEPPGGRHDNDHKDICRIRILPTFGEINSERPEYLPSKEPKEWHLPGVDGLLDKNFRLLREDTVGQLRDAIQRELRQSSSYEAVGHSRRNEAIRTHSYNINSISALLLDRNNGFCFEIQFAQPDRVCKLKHSKRQDWWLRSKRLQVDAFVCLMNKDGLVMFCTVVASMNKPDESNKLTSDRGLSTLYADANIASINLKLVEQDANSLQDLLNLCIHPDNRGQLSLVEFPGVLLPAFYPTLRALQIIKINDTLPFADLIAPSNKRGRMEVSMPAYATKPGFTFSLKSVMASGRDVHLRPGQEFDLNVLTEGSSLDEAQAKSLLYSLTHRLSLIQGPPGTGKSFTGVAALKVLLAHKKKRASRDGIGPIICVCYTNHALDQLLEEVLDSGVTTQIIRIGSQSKSERLQNHNLRVAVQEFPKTKSEKHELWETFKRMDKLQTEFVAAANRLHNVRATTSVQTFLKERYPNTYDQLSGEDEEGFQKVGRPDAVLNAWLHGHPMSMFKQQLSNITAPDLHALPKQRRYALYHSWIQRMIQDLDVTLISNASAYKECQERISTVQDERDLRCLREADIIGVTTSGLARKIEVFRRVNAKVLLCEEAGEVLEPHQLAALLRSLEHLILIGDHQQLRPQVQNFGLSRENRHEGAKHFLDVSLFERLVEPITKDAVQLPYSTLEVQRRMHPLISQLIRETLYPALKDHPSVAVYPSVPGMKKRLFWLDHNEYEASATDEALTTSHWNAFEIDMVTALVTHLLQQGTYKSGDIAVLTPYLGQVHKLRNRLRDLTTITVDERDEAQLEAAGLVADDLEMSRPIPGRAKSNLLQALRVATIDNFQGEEAKVVVVSLVRSNPQRRCWFLKTSNHINVLLSRAKHGMYIIGNSQTSSQRFPRRSVRLKASIPRGRRSPLPCTNLRYQTFTKNTNRRNPSRAISDGRTNSSHRRARALRHQPKPDRRPDD